MDRSGWRAFCEPSMRTAECALAFGESAAVIVNDPSAVAAKRPIPAGFASDGFEIRHSTWPVTSRSSPSE